MNEKFIFEKIKGIVTLVKYIGNEKIILIPNTYKEEPVTSIGENVFYKKENIEEIHIPKNINFVDYLAFYSCYDLKKIVAENDNIKLKKDAFGGQTFLEEASFNLTKILDIDLQYNIVKNLITNWVNLIDKEKNELISLINEKEELKNKLLQLEDSDTFYLLLNEILKLDLYRVDDFLEYHINKKNTTIIAMLLDYKITNFTNDEILLFEERKKEISIGLELPTFEEFEKHWVLEKIDNVIYIKGYKSRAKEQIIPISLVDGSKVTKIKSQYPTSFKNLEILKLNAEISKIEEEAFAFSDLKQIILPNTIEELGKGAFCCSKLEELNLPNKIIIIRENVFIECKNLNYIELPTNLNFIGNACFKLCKQLKEITFPENLITINKYAFSECESLKDIKIPKSLKHLGEYAFKSCFNLKTVNIEAGLITLNAFTFYNCTRLTTIVLPDTIEVIDAYAFYNCTSLKEITIPASVKEIKHSAFSNCLSLNKINFLGDIPLLGEKVFENTPLENKYI